MRPHFIRSAVAQVCSSCPGRHFRVVQSDASRGKIKWINGLIV
jgi:hypothetical protein